MPEHPKTPGLPASSARAPVIETEPTKAAGAHLPAIDGLRGVAILFVIWFHYITACGFGQDAGPTRFIVGVASSMWIGVDLFFVLSGFLITGILLRAKDRPNYFKNF